MSIPALLDYVLEEVSLDGQEGNYIHLLYFAPRSSVGAMCHVFILVQKKYSKQVLKDEGNFFILISKT